MIQLLLFPFNGNAIEALDCIEADSRFKVLGFIDDNKDLHEKTFFGLQIFSRKALDDFPEAKILAVPGSPESYLKRAEVIESLKIRPDRFTTVIHPKACVSKHAVIGTNSLIMAGAVISANARVGDHVCVLPNSVIHHDSTIGDYTLVGSNVSVAGHTSIGSNCYIGSGAKIIHRIEIGNKSLVGLGSTVIRPVGHEKRVVGSPAVELVRK